MVDDLDGACQTLRSAGLSLRQQPKVQPWGLRDLVVADPDGNTLEIAEEIGGSNPV